MVIENTPRSLLSRQGFPTVVPHRDDPSSVVANAVLSVPDLERTLVRKGVAADRAHHVATLFHSVFRRPELAQVREEIAKSIDKAGAHSSTEVQRVIAGFLADRVCAGNRFERGLAGVAANGAKVNAAFQAYYNATEALGRKDVKSARVALEQAAHDGPAPLCTKAFMDLARLDAMQGRYQDALDRLGAAEASLRDGAGTVNSSAKQVMTEQIAVLKSKFSRQPGMTPQSQAVEASKKEPVDGALFADMERQGRVDLVAHGLVPQYLYESMTLARKSNVSPAEQDALLSAQRCARSASLLLQPDDHTLTVKKGDAPSRIVSAQQELSMALRHDPRSPSLMKALSTLVALDDHRKHAASLLAHLGQAREHGYAAWSPATVSQRPAFEPMMKLDLPLPGQNPQDVKAMLFDAICYSVGSGKMTEAAGFADVLIRQNPRDPEAHRLQVLIDTARAEALANAGRPPRDPEMVALSSRIQQGRAYVQTLTMHA